MTSKRYTVELGFGVDLHGENMTEAACRAVKDAVSRSCLCGLVEILGLTDPNQILVDIVIACPKPDDVDLELVRTLAPIGRTTARAINGGMEVLGLCVPSFGPNCDHIVVANAALTVHILDEKE